VSKHTPTIAYDQTYTRIGRTIVYVTGPWSITHCLTHVKRVPTINVDVYHENFLLKYCQFANEKREQLLSKVIGVI